MRTDSPAHAVISGRESGSLLVGNLNSANGGAVVNMTVAPSPPLCAAPLATVKHPRLVMPKNACDTHLHIFGPGQEFPYVPDRLYTPPDCLLADYQVVREYLGVDRCVLVQASVYGSDNRVLLDGLSKLGDVARGVVVLRGDESPAALRRMHELGVRGIRLNFVDLKSPRPSLPRDELRRMADLIGPLGWHIELLVHVDLHPDLEEVLADLNIQLVFGHMGYLSRNIGDPRHEGMKAMVSLMKKGLAWAKITAPYRLDDAPAYQKATDIASWLSTECPERLVWGTDWPHVMVKTAMPHDADLLDLVGGWLPQPHLQHAVFVDNPARLYGWPD